MNLEYTDTPNGEMIIDLQGEMDAPGCSRIRSSLEQVVTSENSNNVILNMAQVSFLDSSGIGVIVFLYKRLKAKGRALEIINVQGQPLELMELLRIGSAIPVNAAPNPDPSQEGDQCSV